MADIQVAVCSGSGNVCLAPQAAICQSQTVGQALRRGDCNQNPVRLTKRRRHSRQGRGQKGKGRMILPRQSIKHAKTKSFLSN